MAQSVSESTSTLDAPGQIRRLPVQLINQIAAGEVVTRPAAALKELIENSLDAGAARIEIHVDEDALGFMVRDDGCGMNEENLRLSVERYATSKIRALEDLERITTRGFRGEALAALASVSRLEIITRTADHDGAFRLKIGGGGEARVEPCGAPCGTTIHVRDLFFNTPARLKFLKNAVAEWGHMLQAAIRQALTRPDVGFSIRWKGKPYMDLPANQSLRQRLAEVLPGEAGATLLDVAGQLQEVAVHGAVSHPSQTRRDRRHQFFFINGRPVVLRPLQFAMEESYRGLIMTQRYPMAAIFIELPGELVDVNVHPTKEEVRLRNDALVAGAVHRAVAEALRAADLVPTLQVAPHLAPSRNQPPTLQPAPREPAPIYGGNKNWPPPAQIPAAAPTETVKHTQLDFAPGFGLPNEFQQKSEPTQLPAAPNEYVEPAALEEATLIARLRASGRKPRVLTQIGITYILADAGDDGMLVIDQHAAHEKILYLEYMRQAAANRIVVQPLLLPHQIDLSAAEAPAMEGLVPGLAAAGFEIEPFGGRTWLVQSIPAKLEKLDVPAFIRDLLDDVGQGDLPKELERLKHKIGARAACRAAVKAGDRLSLPEMERLVEQLLETEEALRCPHGRPTVLLLTREQLDRQFGRLG